jgi:hypothetical protein
MAKVTQVSNVAHELLVLLYIATEINFKLYFKLIQITCCICTELIFTLSVGYDKAKRKIYVCLRFHAEKK